MNRINEISEILSMIEEGYLMTMEDIKVNYDLTQDQIDEAIRTKGLEVVYQVASREYFFSDQVELLVEVLREEEGEEDPFEKA